MDKAEQSLLLSIVLLLTCSVCTPFYEATLLHRKVLPLQLPEDLTYYLLAWYYSYSNWLAGSGIGQHWLVVGREDHHCWLIVS
jgi:hypothetical protein